MVMHLMRAVALRSTIPGGKPTVQKVAIRSGRRVDAVELTLTDGTLFQHGGLVLDITVSLISQVMSSLRRHRCILEASMEILSSFVLA